MFLRTLMRIVVMKIYMKNIMIVMELRVIIVMMCCVQSPKPIINVSITKRGIYIKLKMKKSLHESIPFNSFLTL